MKKINFVILMLIVFSIFQDYQIYCLRVRINKIEEVNSVQSGMLLENKYKN